MPVHMHIRLNKIKRVYRELSTRAGRRPTDEEMARATKIPVEKVREAIEIGRKSETLSLDNTIGDGDDFNLGCLISAEADSPEENSMQRDAAEHLEAVLQVLKPREQEIIRKRFGMDDDTDHTLQQLADRFGVSRERIRQIQNQALDKLRRVMKGKEMWESP
jgi:RNA polymerase primary sigma factor